MKKQLRKSDLLMLVGIFILALGFFAYAGTLPKNSIHDDVIANGSNIVIPFCYHNGTCSTAPRDYSQP